MPGTPEGQGTLETRVTFQGMRLEVRLGDGRTLVLQAKGQGRHRLPVRDMEVR